MVQRNTILKTGPLDHYFYASPAINTLIASTSSAVNSLAKLLNHSSTMLIAPEEKSLPVLYISCSSVARTVPIVTILSVLRLTFRQGDNLEEDNLGLRLILQNASLQAESGD
ncbi:MAG: hypothetical protein R3C11_26740 [Planctomycetaceae bacterium]